MHMCNIWKSVNHSPCFSGGFFTKQLFFRLTAHQIWILKTMQDKSIRFTRPEMYYESSEKCINIINIQFKCICATSCIKVLVSNGKLRYILHKSTCICATSRILGIHVKYLFFHLRPQHTVLILIEPQKAISLITLAYIEFPEICILA